MVKFQFPLRDPAGLSPEAAGRLVKEAIGCTGRVHTILDTAKPG